MDEPFNIRGLDLYSGHLAVHSHTASDKTETKQNLFGLVHHFKVFFGNGCAVRDSAGKTCHGRLVPGNKVHLL